MVWVGTALMAANQKDSKRDDINYLGGFSGLLAQSPVDAPVEEAPSIGDLETARMFGKRIAAYIRS